MQKGIETKVGGLVLLLAAITKLITIFFEYRIGWLVERPHDELVLFIYENWRDLKVIWGWQTLGQALFAIAYLLLFKNSNGLLSVVWAVLFLCAILVVVSMGLTLGSYYPALEVYEDEPALFNSIRGGIGTLYRAGQIGSLTLLIVYFWEAFNRGGVLNKRWGLIIFCVVVISIMLGVITDLPAKVMGATWFLLPIILGYSYWKNYDLKK